MKGTCIQHVHIYVELLPRYRGRYSVGRMFVILNGIRLV